MRVEGFAGEIANLMSSCHSTPADSSRVGEAQWSFIRSARRVQLPDPPLGMSNLEIRHSSAPAGYAIWQSGEVESLVTLWVRLPPRSLE